MTDTDIDARCADCGRELGLSGGRLEGRRICLDCCAARARVQMTDADNYRAAVDEEDSKMEQVVNTSQESTTALFAFRCPTLACQEQYRNLEESQETNVLHCWSCERQWRVVIAPDGFAAKTWRVGLREEEWPQ